MSDWGKTYSKLKRWFSNSDLALVTIGLMLASSGLDGVYMAMWMPESVPWLGYTLNTMADIAALVLSKRFARLQRQRDLVKRRLSFVILAADIVAIGYSWLFSGRQLIRVMPAFEPEAWPWLATISAGFIPLMLGFIGYAQGLSDTRIERTEDKPRQELIGSEMAPLQEPDARFVCETCDASYGSRNALNAHQRAHKSKDNGREQMLAKEELQ